jgi:hypothetical protein
MSICFDERRERLNLDLGMILTDEQWVILKEFVEGSQESLDQRLLQEYNNGYDDAMRQLIGCDCGCGCC